MGPLARAQPPPFERGVQHRVYGISGCSSVSGTISPFLAPDYDSNAAVRRLARPVLQNSNRPLVIR